MKKQNNFIDNQLVYVRRPGFLIAFYLSVALFVLSKMPLMFFISVFLYFYAFSVIRVYYIENGELYKKNIERKIWTKYRNKFGIGYFEQFSYKKITLKIDKYKTENSYHQIQKSKSRSNIEKNNILHKKIDALPVLNVKRKRLDQKYSTEYLLEDKNEPKHKFKFDSQKLITDVGEFPRKDIRKAKMFFDGTKAGISLTLKNRQKNFEFEICDLNKYGYKETYRKLFLNLRNTFHEIEINNLNKSIKSEEKIIEYENINSGLLKFNMDKADFGYNPKTNQIFFNRIYKGGLFSIINLSDVLSICSQNTIGKNDLNYLRLRFKLKNGNYEVGVLNKYSTSKYNLESELSLQKRIIRQFEESIQAENSAR